MSELTVVCWLWKNYNTALDYRLQFGPEQVNILQNMLDRNLKIPHRLVCITDTPDDKRINCETYPLWQDHATLTSHVFSKTHVSCYRRLRIFDPQIALDIGGERILHLDLDTVITGDITPLITKYNAPFVGFRPKVTSRPVGYNGSMFMFDPESPVVHRIWDTFDINRSPYYAKALMYRGTDQGWISTCLRDKYPFWQIADGIYSYGKHHLTDGPPADMRMAMFFGKINPWHAPPQSHEWVREHYK